MRKTIRIGGAVGFWGEAPDATRILIEKGNVDVLIYDYLAEITVSIMARARARDPKAGFAGDFVSDVLTSNIETIAQKGIKVISNAGGMNPKACAKAIEDLCAAKGIDLKVAVVTGDDILDRLDSVTDIREFETGAPLPPQENTLSANAYLGAAPIAKALDLGADIVITGRCVDSALTLGAALWAFQWDLAEYDKLATASLAGHLIECGPQASGGNFTDWAAVPDLAAVGYPIAELDKEGRLFIDKPLGTGGSVTPATVGEQLLYEIGDPTAYTLPDVICDFSQTTLSQIAPNRVEIIGTQGRAPTGKYKVSLTHQTGFRAGYTLMFNGVRARDKAIAFKDMVFSRTAHRLTAVGLTAFQETHFETFGGISNATHQEEITLTLAVRHENPKGVGLFLKDLIGAALAAPPGLHFFTGAGRPKPSPVFALYSFLIDVQEVPVSVTLGDHSISITPPSGTHEKAPNKTTPMPAQIGDKTFINVPLHEIAWARSGDKGNIANIGVIARHPAFMPFIWSAITSEFLRNVFSSEVKGDIERYYLAGLPAMNIVMKEALGGGGIASLRADSQGKGFAQRLLSQTIAIPAEIWAQQKKAEQ